MKRKEIKNKNLMSALTIGISAMMALSTPMTAYASDPSAGEPAPEPEPSAPQTEQVAVQEEVVTSPETVEAQNQADTVQEASTEAENSALNEAVEAANNILEGNEEAGIEAISQGEAGTTADKAIEELEQAAKEIVEDTKDAEGEVKDESAATHLQDASQAMEEIKENLQEADKANHNAEVSAHEMNEHAESAMENAKEAIAWSDAIVQDTTDAQEKADEIINAINSAETEEEAEQAYKELEKNISDTETSIAYKKVYYDKLMDNYQKALDELRKAEEALAVYEQAYNQNLKDALDKAQDAEEEIVDAQTKVDNLAKAIDQVEDKLVEEAIEATKAAEAFDNVTSSNWDQQRELMKSTVENYIIPQLEGKDITNVKWERVSGFDKQDYNYCKITYECDGEVVTRYFNFDKINKTADANRYKGLGSSWGIAVYEKSQEEIDADNFLREKFKNTSFKTEDLQNEANKGTFDVFTYTTESGEKVFLTRDMLKEAMDAGTISLKNGVYTTSDGSVVKEIIQNSNSLIHGGDAYLIANETDVTKKYKNAIMEALKQNHTKEEAEAIYNNMVADNQAYHSYISFAKSVLNEEGEYEHVLSAKYEKYEAAVEQAQDAVDQAKEEAQKLTDAIGDLSSLKKNRYILAKAALGVDDIATYFGMDVSPEEAEALNKMTAQEAARALGDYLKLAQDNLDTAQVNLDGLKKGYEDARANVEAAKERLKPAEEAGGQEEGGQEVEPGGQEEGGQEVEPGGQEIEPDAPAGPEVEPGGQEIEPDAPGNIDKPSGSETPGTPGGSNRRSDGTGGGSANSITDSDAQAGGIQPGGDNASPSGAESGTAGGDTVSPATGGDATAPAPAANAQTVSEAAGGAEVVAEAAAQGAAEGGAAMQTQIDDEAVALAEAFASPDDVTEFAPATSTIVDAETALAEKPLTKGKMNWWWALIILLMGERGRELYVKYKKEAIEETEDQT